MNQIDYSLHYRRWHDGSVQELEHKKQFYEKLIGKELEEINPESKVLDYGCGFGALVYYLLDKGFEAEGVDASSDQVGVCLKNGLPVSEVTIETFSRWAEEKSDTYDIIFLMDVLEHVPADEQIKFMQALVGTLKKGGTMYVKVPNANSPLASRWRYIDWTHTSAFTECSLEFVCSNVGLSDYRYLRDDSSLRPKYPWVPRKLAISYWIKATFRGIWRLYLVSEHGREGKQFPIGLNIFISAKKT